MKRFIRFCILLCLPILLMVVFYIEEDPFKVIWHYENYYSSDDVIPLNRGYVSAMHYTNHHKEYGYDSFIFGNSRSIAYQEDEWKKYIPESSRCYHFDVSGGTIRDLYCEINYINKSGTLRNALIILDVDVLEMTEGSGIHFSIPPILKDGQNLVVFHNQYFKSFYQFGFFRAYIDYKTHKEVKPYMYDHFFTNPRWKLGYNPMNNELNWEKQEESILDGTFYDAEKIKVFENAQFPGKVQACALNNDRKEFLKKIKEIFNAQNTDYRLIISPLYKQTKINPDDLQFLYDVFGEDYVFDFSGINKWNEDFHNYYETSHYRPCVANEIMQIVYSEDEDSLKSL